MSVIEIGPHDRMTPEEALACAAREKWDKVIICGFHKDKDDFVVRSSTVTREEALWIGEHVKMWSLGTLYLGTDR